MITTGTSNHTIWIEDGEEVYPCRCGETHRGDYAPYDFAHHNCEQGPMWLEGLDVGLIMCSECGQSFEVA